MPRSSGAPGSCSVTGGAVEDQQGHEARQAKRGDAPAGREEGEQRPPP